MHSPALRLIESRIRRLQANRKHYAGHVNSPRADIRAQAEYELDKIDTVLVSLHRSLETLKQDTAA